MVVEASRAQDWPCFINDAISPSVSSFVSTTSIDRLSLSPSCTDSKCLLRVFDDLTLFDVDAWKESEQRDNDLSHARAQRPRPSKRWRRAGKVNKLKQFARFRCFPAEIRLKIWKLCFPPPLRITLESSWKTKRLYKRQRENHASVTHHHQVNFHSHKAVPHYIGPVTLRICQESRIETLKTYTFLFSNNPLISPVYFSGKRDVFNIKGDETRSNIVRSTKALSCTSPWTELRHIKCISIPSSDFEIKWMAEELLGTCKWVEELILRADKWPYYPSSHTGSRYRIRQLGERWFFYKQSSRLSQVPLKTLQVTSSSGRMNYGEEDLTTFDAPPAVILEERYADRIDWSAAFGLRPLNRPRPVWREYE